MKTLCYHELPFLNGFYYYPWQSYIIKYYLYQFQNRLPNNHTFLWLWKVWLIDWPFLLVITDIDECASGVHDCHSSASCTNTVGSFTCSCNHPFTGDGKTCRHSASGKYSMLILFWNKYCILKWNANWLNVRFIDAFKSPVSF